MVYGDLKLARSYCSVPAFELPGEWQHGWHPNFVNKIPEAVIGSDGLSRLKKNKVYFVAREDQKEALAKNGYTHVHAIGLPIIYLKKKDYVRKERSLLVMPAHTLIEMNEESCDQEYRKYLFQFRGYFSKITLCLHRACFVKRRWQALCQIADNVVVGASTADSQSYSRMAELMSTHEFMTTNEFGSHVPYAAYFGCKVSVAGPRPAFNEQELARLTFYKNCPECLRMRAGIYREDTFAKHFPFFKVEPHAANLNIAWARREIGLQCKKTPRELRQLFGWEYTRVPAIFANAIVKRTRLYVNRFRVVLNFIRFFGPWGLVVPFKLKSARSRAEGHTKLHLGDSLLHIRNGSSDVEVVVQHFGRRELLDIDYPSEVTNIIDLGANIGISAIAFRRLFRKAKIVAVEMNADNFELLSRNCPVSASMKLVNGAIWSNNGFIEQVDVGDGAWAIRAGSHQGKILDRVTSYSFDRLLEIHNIDHVDVCKMDIEGAEAEVLLASWQIIFSKTKLLIVEIHPWISGCGEKVNRAIELAKQNYNLSTSYSGEFTIIRNLDL